VKRIDTSEYHPLYFLAALGAGGLTVSFFLYFLFLVPHPATPMAERCHLPGVPAGDPRPRRSPPSLPVHELHPLRAQAQHRPRDPV